MTDDEFDRFIAERADLSDAEIEKLRLIREKLDEGQPIEEIMAGLDAVEALDRETYPDFGDEDDCTLDQIMAGNLAERTHEIHAEIVNELVAKGESPSGPPEWDAYHDRRDEPGFCGPSATHQEAWRRACEENPKWADALARLGAGE